MKCLRYWLFAGLFIISICSNATPMGPVIEGLDCIFPEPETVICSGQHPGDATTATRQLEDTVTTTAGSISSAASSAFRSAFNNLLGSVDRHDLTSGLAAGDNFMTMSAWASFTHIDTDNTHQPTRYNSTVNSVLVGFDVVPSVNENLVFGVALGLEDTSINTVFNAGEQENEGFTIAPYIGYLITPNFSVDASVGLTSVDIDQTRLDATNLTSIINGDTESDRWFIAGNLNYFREFTGHWFFSGRLGLVYAEDDIDAVVETGGPDAFTSDARNLNFGQVQVAAELAYTGMEFEPYLMAMYENDFEREDVLLNSAQAAPANDDDSFRLGFGMRYYWSNEASIHFAFDWQVDRDEYESNALSVTGRWAF